MKSDPSIYDLFL